MLALAQDDEQRDKGPGTPEGQTKNKQRTEVTVSITLRNIGGLEISFKQL